MPCCSPRDRSGADRELRCHRRAGNTNGRRRDYPGGHARDIARFQRGAAAWRHAGCLGGGARRLPCRTQPGRGALRLTARPGGAPASRRAPSRPSPPPPSCARAWPTPGSIIGLARYRQGAVEDAKTAMRQALQAQPGHAAAPPISARFMRITGELEAAEALLREALARDPHDAGARLNLVAELLQEERPAEALALLDEAIRPPTISPPRRHWHLQRALALLQLGRPDRGADRARRIRRARPRAAGSCAAAALARPAAGARRGTARRCARRGAGDGGRARAMGPDGRARTQHHGALRPREILVGPGRRRHALSRIGARAMRCCRPIQPFSRAGARAPSSTPTIATFTPQRVCRRRRAPRNADPAPVFIVGMPRSGTTLVEQILGRARAGAWRRRAAGARAGLRRRSAAATTAEVGAPHRRARRTRRSTRRPRRYLADLHALAPDKTRIVDKMPGNYLYLGLSR